MDKIQTLITPDVHSAIQLKAFGWSNNDITRYCQTRARKWGIGTRIFRNMFSNLGMLFVHKEYDKNLKNMVVTVYKQNGEIVVQSAHNDPLFALAECAKNLNREDDFLSALMSNLKV